jgi:uncharacterized protein (DUF169 family)
MKNNRWPKLNDFLAVIGLDEEPLGLFYTDQAPVEGFSPTPMDLPTREKESKGEIDWAQLQAGWSCAMGHIWRARRKKTTAWFSAERFGCNGAAFYLGFQKPQLESVIHYVSTGIPGMLEGEHYVSSPDVCRSFFEQIDPRSAPASCLVVKPLSLFTDNETPEVIAMFARPEVIGGLCMLTGYVTDELESVKTPFGAGCSHIAAWPFYYLSQGQNVAVLGGWDPSSRKFYKTDELSFAIPLPMFQDMLQRWPDSFLTKPAWKVSQKKIARSKKTWGEI